MFTHLLEAALPCPDNRPSNAPDQKINVYVHLAYGFDAQKWQQDWKSGTKIGLNEEFPYGYHHAAAFGAQRHLFHRSPGKRAAKIPALCAPADLRF